MVFLRWVFFFENLLGWVGLGRTPYLKCLVIALGGMGWFQKTNIPLIFGLVWPMKKKGLSCQLLILEEINKVDDSRWMR